MSVNPLCFNKTRLLAQAFLVLLCLQVFAVASVVPTVLEGSWFTVVSEDRAEAARIRAVGEKFGNFARHGGLDLRKNSTDARIEILPRDLWTHELSHLTEVLCSGEVLLALPGEPQAGEIEIARALSELWWTLRERQGRGASSGISAWRVNGLAAAYLEHEYPGYFSTEVPEWPTSLEAWLHNPTAPPHDAQTLSHWFWLWRYIEKGGEFGATRGHSGEEREDTGHTATQAVLELDWRTFLNQQRETGFSSVHSAKESEDALFDLLEIRVVVDGGATIGATMVDLWEDRELDWVQRECRLRLQFVKRMLPTVNPIYFNTFHSFGSMLESLVQGQEGDFKASVAVLAEDLKAARNVREALEKSYP